MKDRPVTQSAAAPAHDTPPVSKPQGFTAELRDAVSKRGVLLIIGVFALQLGFVLSYIGAFHAPKPHHLPVAVVAPEQISGQVVKQLNSVEGDALDAQAIASEQQARARILDRTIDAAIIINPKGTTDTLLVASAAGPAVSSTAEQIAQTIEKDRHRQVTIDDIRPPAASDGRGMSSFYLVLGWMVGGYLAATILGMAGGARPANVHRTVIRLGSLALYAIVSGLGGAIIVGPLLGALEGHFAALWALGALIVFASAATTVAFQVLWGIIGVGVTILLFVVIGNPSAGGAYPAVLLPTFWRSVGEWLPPGAGTTVVRNTIYFSGNAIAQPLWVLAGYAVLGTALAVTTSALHLRRNQSLADA